MPSSMHRRIEEGRMKAEVLAATKVADCEICHKAITARQAREQKQGYVHDCCRTRVGQAREDR